MQFPQCEENGYSDNLLKKFTLLLSLTSLCTFFFGNLLLFDISTLLTSIGLALSLQFIIFAIFSVAHFTRSLAWSIAIMYTALATSILLNTDLVYYIVVATGLYGFVLFLKTTYVMTNASDKNDLLKAVIFGALVVISAKVPGSFDMIDRLELGTVHRDTLFHASIASMIKNYGVISTGLNGLAETPYHILSHTLIASIGSMANIGILETYGVAPLLFFIPLLLTSIAYVATTFGKEEYFYRYFILTGFILAASPRLLKIWGLKESYFGSESYLVALALLVLSLPLLLKKTYQKSDLALVLIMLALMTFAKASVGAIFFGLLAVRLIWFTRSNIKFAKELLLFLLSTVIVFYILTPSLTATRFADETQFWEYIRHYSLFGNLISGSIYLAAIPIILFILLHYIFSWITISSRVSVIGIKQSINDPVIIYSLAAILGGLLVVFLPIVPGSIGGYFSNVAMFISLPWFVIVMAEKRINWIRNPYMTALLIILLFKSTKLLDKSLFKRDIITNTEHVAFIQTLLNIRESTATDVYLQPDNIIQAEEFNPTPICMAKPFVYPAVSERVWTGVINMQATCDYKNYGYQQYFKDKGANKILSDAIMPPGTKLTVIYF